MAQSRERRKVVVVRKIHLCRECMQVIRNTLKAGMKRERKAYVSASEFRVDSRGK